MKSKEELEQQFNELPEDAKLVISKNMVGHGLERVIPTIDKFTSAKLKRVLKAVSMVFIAEKTLNEKAELPLEEDEQKLIDDIFALQETVFGHSRLVQELEQNKKEENNFETSNDANIETTLETKL